MAISYGGIYMRTNPTYIWPVGGDCNFGCPYYIEGSLENKRLKLGDHCRFDGFKGEGKCGANALNPQVTDERIKRAEKDETAAA